MLSNVLPAQLGTNCARQAAKLPVAGDCNWPMAGTQIVEIDATLLTLKGIYDRPVWSEQFRESAVACQSRAVAHPAGVNDSR